MLRAADLSASTSRPISLRLRSDLGVLRQQYQGRDFWVLKDPLRLKYFRFEEEEYWLLQQLNGQATLGQMQQRFEQRFAPQKISTREIYHLIGLAHRSGLVISDGAGQGSVLLERQREAQQKRRWSVLSELLSLRFRGCDPDRLLTALDKFVGWLFTWPAVIAGSFLGLAALLLVATHWNEFYLRLPSSTEFFGPTNWFLLAATLAFVKILHEFGHGLACKRFGGECHEMGLLVFCFTPCLYCDVTDSWTIPSKWRRAAIAAAGMYVELWLAAIATFLWWYTEPGLLHHLALNVMFVGSVSTLVFNANPLMRYDGYYILADLVEIPNLRTKANSLLQRYASRFLFNSKSPADPFLPARRRRLLACYAVASAVYRWMVTASILWFLYKLTEPYGYKVVGQMLAVGALAGLIGVPLYSLGKSLHHLWQWERNMNTSQAAFRLTIVAGVLIGLFCVPLPYYVRCAMRLQPHDAAAVYVDVPGEIAEILVQPGDAVQQGQPLLKLRNLDLELAVAQLQTQCESQARKVATLRQRSVADSSALAEVTQAEETLAALKEDLQRRTEQLGHLIVTAPRAGIVLPAPRRPDDQQAKDQLPAWHGHPLESRNRSARLEASDLVCFIGDRHEWEAVLAIDGHDMDFVRTGQRVDLLPAQRPGERIATTLASLSRRDMEVTPAAMSAKSGGELLTQTDHRGRERPVFVTYEASATFEDASSLLASGGGGIARIHAGYQTPATRLWRAVRRTFHFEM
jgi:putative peptide zinc metalloprotease protein